MKDEYIPTNDLMFLVKIVTGTLFRITFRVNKI